MRIKETPNKVTAALKVTATAEFFDDEASKETLRYCIEQGLEDAGFDVDVTLLKEQEAEQPIVHENSYGWKFYYCPKCKQEFYQNRKQAYCDKCGQKVKWDG